MYFERNIIYGDNKVTIENNNNVFNRCYTLELYRFLACIFIAIYHFEWIYIGSPVHFQHFYIWVEFFYVLSGFFLARNIIANNSTVNEPLASIKYTFSQALKLYPQYILAFIFSFGIACIVNDWEKKEVIINLFKAKWEILMLQLGGFDKDIIGINNVTAYISGLIIATLILHYLIQNHLKLFSNVIAPLIVIGIYSHIIQVYGNLSQWLAYDNWFCIGVLRAIAGMSVGALAFICLNKVFACMQRKFLFVINSICIVLCMSLVIFKNQISFADLLIFVPIFAIIISITYINVTMNKEKSKKDKIYNYLGKLSYPVFLVHYGICELLHFYLKGFSYYQIIVPYIITIIILAIILKKLSFLLQIITGKIIKKGKVLM